MIWGGLRNRERDMIWRQLDELGRRLDDLRDDMKEIDARRRDDKSVLQTADSRIDSRIKNAEKHVNNLYGHQHLDAVRTQVAGNGFVPPSVDHDEDPEAEAARMEMLERIMGDPMGDIGYNSDDLIDDQPQAEDVSDEDERSEVGTQEA